MKTTLAIVLLVCFSGIASAQNKSVNDSLLLDYYQTQRYKEAADYLKTSYPEPITDDKVISSLAYTSQMAGKLADAEGYYVRLLDKDSLNIPVLFSLGNINIRRGNNPKAMSFYRKILLKDSTNFMVYKQLANCSRDINDIASFIVYLQKANKINPAEPDVAADLSDMYVNMKLLPQAEAVLNVAIAGDPENITLLESLLKLTFAQKKWDETITSGEKIKALGAATPSTLNKLGIAYYNIKNYTCTLETLMAIADEAQSETSYYYMAMAYKGLNNQIKAIEYLDKTIVQGISPNIDSYYAESADSYQILKRYSKAATAYKKALQFDQKPMTYYAIADLYDAQMKDTAAAINYYKKYISAKPPVKQKTYVDYAKDRVIRLKK